MKKITEEMIAIAIEDGWSEDNAKRGYAIFTGTLGEDTDSELDYYIKETPAIGDTAWLYAKEYDTIQEMRIKQVICRSDDVEAYDANSENVLIDGESEYDADTSAEFITDNDSYLVWFDYM